ncbi:MAG: T9SS type A sorting domain-containing protein, partial [Bacteroidota bacterium]
FDQTKLPSPAILEVGRIDLTNLPAFNKDDIELTRDYLNRNHAWRNGKWKVIERGLIDNNFTNFNLASTGYANFIAILGIDSVFDNRDYMNSQKVGSYLLSYGCGAGSYTSCSGIGNTSSFANDSFENVFTILSGSYFGDWDNVNNFLRAPLASSSLGSFWGGIPKWYIHHMGVGERIGKGVKISQNNTGFYFTGNFNMSHNSMHIAYMGDPTLKIRNLPAVESLTAVSSNNLVYLNWNRIGDQSYAIYRFDTLNRVFNRIHNLPINDTFFIDSFNHASGRYVYAVKCIKLETTGSGTFYNTGGAAYSTVEHINSVSAINDNQNLVYIYPNPVSEQIHIKIDTRIISTSTLSAKIYDLYGKGIMEFQIQPSSNRDVIMDVRELNDGIYICEIKGNGILNRQKILVSK